MRVRVLVFVSLYLVLASGLPAEAAKVKPVPPPDPVSSLSAGALGAYSYMVWIAAEDARVEAERVAAAAEEARLAEEARVAALRTAPAPRVSVPANSSWETFAACVIAHESGGNPTAQNPRSSASGLFQDLDSTWGGYGGYARAADAPVAVQYERNYQLWAGGAGVGHWAGSGCY